MNAKLIKQSNFVKNVVDFYNFFDFFSQKKQKDGSGKNNRLRKISNFPGGFKNRIENEKLQQIIYSLIQIIYHFPDF